MSAGEAIFAFEAPEVEWLIDALVDEPFRSDVIAALDRRRELLDGRRGWHGP